MTDTVDRHGKRAVSNAVMTPANMLTFLRILLVPLYLWLFSFRTWWSVTTALVVFIIAAVTDLIDGRLARDRAEITALGKFLDPLADKFLVIGALLQFALMGLVNIWLVLVIAVRDVWVTAMRIVALYRGSELKTSGGAKVKTTIQLTAIITIIVFSGGRLIAVAAGVGGAYVDPGYYTLFYNLLVAVAVVFTLYSWMKYLARSRAAR